MEGSEIKSKLAHLLPHWVEHNDAHLGTFNQWTERAEKAGMVETAAAIGRAAALAEQSGVELKKALKELEGEK